MVIPFLSGAVTFGFGVAALFFLRFWRDTRDELFPAFAIAFILLGVSQGILDFGGFPAEQRTWVFVIRLVAFMLILKAIVRKNRM